MSKHKMCLLFTECSKLRRTKGASITCDETSELKHCVISCRPGLYFSYPPLPYYECGVATGYKWNHQNDDNNPTGRLPSCSGMYVMSLYICMHLFKIT